MSESLRNDGRIWVPKDLKDVEKIKSEKLKPTDIKEETEIIIWKEDTQPLEI